MISAATLDNKTQTHFDIHQLPIYHWWDKKYKPYILTSDEKDPARQEEFAAVLKDSPGSVVQAIADKYVRGMVYRTELVRYEEDVLYTFFLRHVPDGDGAAEKPEGDGIVSLGQQSITTE